MMAKSLILYFLRVPGDLKYNELLVLHDSEKKLIESVRLLIDDKLIAEIDNKE